ncbi:MAG: hypothetical protein [Bacteriophage sp.]|nr:MAG: hypothetical protein [Bacteriophage sp.]DAK43131.1 MAG TPA: hypothetical protein [Caudoviricetes sp.]UVY34443.1 MAG: hypothetical protein [Bacteriophage sp.]UWD70932.1 MAG: hypothetical protein [Bacteriophage sp.]UWG77653.1 MAG: hypothetical protein [Bacteriophage sp.]
MNKRQKRKRIKYEKKLVIAALDSLETVLDKGVEQLPLKRKSEEGKEDFSYGFKCGFEHAIRMVGCFKELVRDIEA